MDDKMRFEKIQQLVRLLNKRLLTAEESMDYWRKTAFSIAEQSKKDISKELGFSEDLSQLSKEIDNLKHK